MPPPTNFFTDSVGVVSTGASSQIEQKLRDFEKASSNQVLVVVADHVPEGYTSIEEYTNRTAEAWRVGDKARDNGAVMFVFVG
ncbi:MAG: TPM domain-containing protein, partial [Vicinamibacteria bacterium]